ncbi:hypothetical protein FACS189459_6490 [Bacilli bacterium]|nr:hypothetical protein FACS189459_6490 [Bacilli bacterium]
MYRFIFVKKCASIEKIAYFDPDVFFKCDVAEFYNENIEKYHIGGSVDYNVKLNKEGHVKKCPNY